MKTLLIIAFAIVGLALAFGPTPSRAAPSVPAECTGMTFTSTVYATSFATLVNDAGVVLVVGLPTARNVISVPNAAQSCIVGGSADDVIKAGSGNDVIVGNGGSDIISGGLGTDTCYGHGIIACETIAP